jgi:hypothetical protein
LEQPQLAPLQRRHSEHLVIKPNLAKHSRQTPLEEQPPNRIPDSSANSFCKVDAIRAIDVDFLMSFQQATGMHKINLHRHLGRVQHRHRLPSGEAVRVVVVVIVVERDNCVDFLLKGLVEMETIVDFPMNYQRGVQHPLVKMGDGKAKSQM